MLNRYGKSPYKVAVIHGGPGACGSVACIALELSKKCGTLEPIQTKYNIPDLIDELHEQLRTVVLEPITLVGHSWGAWLIALYAARYPGFIKQLVMVGSGPFKMEYVPQMLKRRLNNLTDSEAETFKLILSQLKDDSVEDKDTLLAALGALAEKTDSYELEEDDGISNNDPIESAPLSAKMYTSIWPQAAKMRSTGKLIDTVSKITCPIIVIQGDHDPHPIEGIIEPLQERVLHIQAHVLPKCGHSPFREKFAKTQFYDILATLL